MRLAAAGIAQVRQRAFIDGEEPRARAVLRGHVGDDGAFAGRQARHAGTEELDELSRDAQLAQPLRHYERQIGGETPLRQPPFEPHTDHLGNPQSQRHAEHDGFGLDAADAPAEHAQAVDHRRVTVRANQRVGNGPAHAVPLLHADHGGEALHVDGVHDAGAGREDAEAPHRIGRPLHEAVALGVPLHLAGHVVAQGIRPGRDVHRHRMVGRGGDRAGRVQPRRVAAGLGQGVAHRRYVHQRRPAGRVVHQDAAGCEGDFRLAPPRLQPVEQRAPSGLGRIRAGLAQHVLQQDAVTPRHAFQSAIGGGPYIDVPHRAEGAGQDAGGTLVDHGHAALKAFSPVIAVLRRVRAGSGAD
jgi:hypothetical protein